MAGLEERVRWSEVLEKALCVWIRSMVQEEDGQAGNEQSVNGPQSHGGEDVLHPESSGEPLWGLRPASSKIRLAS